MQFTKSESESSERMFISMNARICDVVGSADANNLNVRGFTAFLDADSVVANDALPTGLPRSVPVGQSCLIGSLAMGALQPNRQMFALGVVESSLICKVNPIVGPAGDSRIIEFGGILTNYQINRWVLIQTYGYMDRVVVDRVASSSTDELLFVSPNGDYGWCYTMSAADVDAAKTLTGVATIDTSGASAVMNLNGTNTATVTWSTAPVVTRLSAFTFPLPHQACVGYIVKQPALSNLEEHGALSAGGKAAFASLPGWIMCMGASPRG